jgi:hypothetical protein
MRKMPLKLTEIVIQIYAIDVRKLKSRACMRYPPYRARMQQRKIFHESDFGPEIFLLSPNGCSSASKSNCPCSGLS